MKKLQKVSEFLFCALALLVALWLSFFVEPIQSKYGHLIIISLFAALSFIILANRAMGRAIPLDKTDTFLWAYILMVTSSVFFAQNRQIAINQYIRYAVPIPIIYYLFKNGFPLVKNKRRLMITICILASIMAFIAIIETIFRKNIIYENLYLRNYYGFYQNFFIKEHRAVSTQIVPQALGTCLIACIPAAYSLIYNEKKRYIKILAILCAILISIGVILTLTLIIFLAGAVTSILYFYYKKNRNTVFFIIIAFALMIACFTFLSKRQFPSWKIRVSGLTNILPYKHRINRIITTASILKDYPLTGAGIGNFRYVFDRYYIATKKIPYYWKVPDNMYLSILGETGLLGFFTFILFMARLLKMGFKFLKFGGNNENKEIALFLLTAICGMLLSMANYDALYWTVPFYLFWIYCGMLASLMKTKENV
ncbi:MAG: O-antigen ligase family protein [Candidatus Omnitrophica bacterium]|jgi:O-antigen ligase|nr:O-antigen ligase family protein [Candidatus Omnitrophota bacterium]